MPTGGATAGGLPVHCQLQIQHQLVVSKAAVADVFVFRAAEVILLEVAPKGHVRAQ
jgi:predicted phage-related endonuclease